MDFKTLLQLPVLDINQVISLLQEIADKERSKEKPSMPKVSISTQAGHVSGYFVNYNSEKRTILLCDLYDRNAELQYIQSHAIASISLTNINNYTYLFSDGKIAFMPPANEIPTILQLKKDLKNVEVEVKAALNIEIAISFNYDDTPSDIEKYYAAKGIALLKETITSLSEDKLVKTTFTEMITTVDFKLGTENKVVLKNKGLLITLDISKNLKSVASKTELQNKIEQCL
ncbi:hypothetical protein [Olleya sp. HaHaR_3_96]|uniref:hypothetical protein n=1 Tax=Olleya sp. HaHaR_3_96 TaxID=2745560 RepID=UPI001C4FAF9E|nr:hypothetical protein [Olleya sp. HaHaR_3_96]QXP59996.1 hypothetical protein H0I26_19155 [Olleya sp. HaHaR_3_96]